MSHYEELYKAIKNRQSRMVDESISELYWDNKIPNQSFGYLDQLPFGEESDEMRLVWALDDRIFCLQILMEQYCWAKGFLEYQLIPPSNHISNLLEEFRLFQSYRAQLKEIRSFYQQIIHQHFQGQVLKLIQEYELAKKDYIQRICNLSYVAGHIHANIFLGEETQQNPKMRNALSQIIDRVIK